MQLVYEENRKAKNKPFMIVYKMSNITKKHEYHKAATGGREW